MECQSVKRLVLMQSLSTWRSQCEFSEIFLVDDVIHRYYNMKAKTINRTATTFIHQAQEAKSTHLGTIGTQTFKLKKAQAQVEYEGDSNDKDLQQKLRIIKEEIDVRYFEYTFSSWILMLKDLKNLPQLKNFSKS